MSNSVNSVNSVNSINSVNSYSAVLPPSPMVSFLLNSPDALYPEYPGFFPDCHPGKEKLKHDFAMLILEVSLTKLNYLQRVLPIKTRKELRESGI